jgi:hypothetical protein
MLRLIIQLVDVVVMLTDLQFSISIQGGLECPAHGGWHEDAVKARVNRYCRASKALGLPNLMSMGGCAVSCSSYYNEMLCY